MGKFLFGFVVASLLAVAAPCGWYDSAHSRSMMSAYHKGEYDGKVNLAAELEKVLGTLPFVEVQAIGAKPIVEFGSEGDIALYYFVTNGIGTIKAVRDAPGIPTY
jgi:hypothetical protein